MMLLAKNSKAKKEEKSCVSVVLVWKRSDFYENYGGKRGEGGSIMQEFLKNVSDYAKSISEKEVRFESRSTLVSNQLRVDIGFESEAEARMFKLKVNEFKNLPVELTRKTFFFSEAEMDFNLGPILTEIDILHIVKFDRLENLFRHFLTCSVVMEDNNIVFRFNSVADVNLFLYNKCRNSNKRILGKFRQNQEQLQLLPGRDGKFSLIVHHVRKESDSWIWEDWEEKYKFKKKLLDNVKYLQFENKLELYQFFASDEAKIVTELRCQVNGSAILRSVWKKV